MSAGGGGGGGGDLPIVSLYITLLQGHFYLLCTVMVIANLVRGGGRGAIASLTPVTTAPHKIGGLTHYNGHIHNYRCGGHVTTHGGASSV